MTKYLKFLFAVLLSVLAVGCNPQKSEGHLSAVVDSVGGNSLMVTTEENADFDKALIEITDDTIIADVDGNELTMENIKMGTQVSIIYTDAVREKNPVSVTAEKIVVDPYKKANEMSTVKYIKLKPQEAKEKLDSDSSILLVDVRTPEEYAQERINGSVNLPDYDIQDKAAQVLPDKQAKIYLYCRSGRRSEAAAKELIDMGYTNVYEFGGILERPYEITR